MGFELINPVGLEKPVGYAHLAKITGGTIVHVAGQAPFDERGEVVGKDDFFAQFRQDGRNFESYRVPCSGCQVLVHDELMPLREVSSSSLRFSRNFAKSSEI